MREVRVVRFTLDPLGDVDLPIGVPLREARAQLAALTGVAALDRAPLTCGPHRLAEDHCTGTPPWVEGSRLSVADGAALVRPPAPPHARWWVAVVDGPDAGLVAGARRRLRVGAGAGPADEDRLWLGEPGGGTLIGLAGVWWWCPRRALPRPVRRFRVGSDVLVPVRAADLAAGAAPGSEGPVPGDGGRARTGAARPGPSFWLWLVPVLATAAAAVVWRSPVLALLGLGSLAPALSRWPRRSRPWGGGPAAVSVALATRGAGERPPAWLDLATHGLAVVGPRAQTLGAARALVGAALLDAGLVVEVAAGARTADDWGWLRWTGATTTTRRLVVVDGGRAPVDGAATLVLAEDLAAVPAGVRHVVRLGRGARLPRATQAWAEAHGRAVAGLGAGSRAPAPSVALADLPTSGPGDWAVPLGLREDGTPFWLDLLADGPHVLVAGTTGSGKSELLQSLVLALARRHPPDRVAFVLVDFKGGAGLGACRRLPHVAGTVTDLDPDATERVLAGVRAELRDRERLCAAAGVRDLEELRAVGDAPPRLVVVVDELLALREDLPGVIPALIRLASQGRALGIHLVLATQRPSGALDAQVRANVATKICLRVSEPADALDVIGAPDAAFLPVDRPGRALVRRGHDPLEQIQVAWAALRPGPAGARWASGPTGTTPAPVAPLRADHLETVLREVHAGAASFAAAPALWRPPLPAHVALDAVALQLGAAGPPAGRPTVESPAAGPDPALVLGLVDRPDERSTAPLLWRPEAGPLVVVGPAGSGRSTALATAAEAAAGAGRVVHAVHASRWQWPSNVPAELRGTVVGADDPPRVLRLVEVLLGSAGTDLLVLDDLDAVRHALARVPRGLGDAVLASLQVGRVPLAVAGTARQARQVDVPGLWIELGGHGPGRGTAAGSTVQVAVPSVSPTATLDPGTCDARGAVPRLRPLPGHVSTADLARVGDDPPPASPLTASLTLGLGGDDAGPVRVDLGRGLLVVGPAGSGRSTLAARVLREVAGACPAGVVPEHGRPVVLDDADLVLPGRPDLDDQLTAWATAAEARTAGPRPVVVARTDRAATSFRGVVAALRTAAPVLVLSPTTPGSAEAAGIDLSRFWQPDAPTGRAVLVDRGRVVPVQIAEPA